ncbi:MAG: phosphotransferase family protein, partial [Candidatus Rokuibacteriota bacterium]
MPPDTAPVRPGEELDAAALQDYLRGKVESVDRLEIEQFPGGHSNLTYLVRCGGREYVLRRAPLGPVAAKAHDMARECAVLRAVHPHFPPAPEVFLLCEDPSVIGAVFFLMERRRGVVVRGQWPAEWEGRRDLPARISQSFVECLGALHAVDIERHGLAAIGHPEGFLERQVSGWTDRWRRAQAPDRDYPEMERVISWL